MVWTIEYAESTQKDIRKLDPAERRRIREFLEGRVAALDDPRSIGKALSGSLRGLWRYRVGDYRVIVSIEDKRLCVLVLKVGHRRSVYRQ